MGLILRVLQGASGGLMSSCIVSTTSLWFPIKQRGLASGILFACIGFGFSITVAGGNLLLGLGLNWTKSLAMLICVPGVIVTALYAFTVKNVSDVYPGHYAIADLMPPEPESAGGIRVDTEKLPGTMAEARKGKKVWALALTGFVNSWMILGFSAFLSHLLGYDLKVDSGLVATVMSLTFLVGAAGSILSGGVAGCEAAIVAAQRGHQVTLLEKSDRLGGQFIVASLPIGKGEFNSFIVWQKHMIQKLGITVVYHTEATRAVIDSYKPDAVLVANGSNPAMPPIPGLRENGTIAHKYLLGEKNFGQNVVVIGGGLVGAETADHMAVHGAARVTIVEMMPDIMVDGEPGPTFYVKQRFREHGVIVHTNAKVVAVEPTAVVYEKDGKQHRIEDVDTIVTAIGAVPDRSIADALTGSPYEVKVIGDASSTKNGFKNIQEGYEAGLYI